MFWKHIQGVRIVANTEKTIRGRGREKGGKIIRRETFTR